MPNFRIFHRHREGREKGGVAILIKETIALNAVLVWQGVGENEVLSVMFPTLSPKLVVTASYGIQANTYGPAMQESNLREILGKLAGWLEDGYRCLWAGDVNLLLGAEHIPGNDPVVSSAGKILNDFITRYDLSIANKMSVDPTTHKDLRSGKKRA